jgi:hypothetical protein
MQNTVKKVGYFKPRVFTNPIKDDKSPKRRAEKVQRQINFYKSQHKQDIMAIYIKGIVMIFILFELSCIFFEAFFRQLGG